MCAGKKATQVHDRHAELLAAALEDTRPLAALIRLQHVGSKSITPGIDRSAPDDVIFIDLETRSKCDLKVAGGRRYAKDPTTEIISVAAVVGGRLVAWFPTLDVEVPAELLRLPTEVSSRISIEVFTGPTLPGPLREAIAAGKPMCAHNAYEFDMHVWRAKNLPEPAQWLDTLPHARAGGLPGRLDSLGSRLVNRTKDCQGKYLLKRIHKENEDGTFVGINQDEAVQLMRYNINDVLLLQEIYPHVARYSEPSVLMVHRKINDRGIYFDLDLARAIVDLDRTYVQRVVAKAIQLTEGELSEKDFRRVKHLLEWLRSKGYDEPDLRNESIQRFLGRLRKGEFPNCNHEVVQAVLQARVAVARNVTSRLKAAIASVEEDGRIRGLFQYHKAHTGRWAGRGLQPHNLPRPHSKLKNLPALMLSVGDPDEFLRSLPEGVEPQEAIVALIRPCIRAAPGRTLVTFDYNAIEARGLAWCAGEQKLLKGFAEGADIYCEMASQLFGFKVTKQHEKERQVGKAVVLGCGYGMGARRFADYAASQGIDLGAVGLSADSAVETYRRTYPAIARLWEKFESAARAATQRGLSRTVGRCQLYRDSDALVIQLPSGRPLYYRNARIERPAVACDAAGSTSSITKIVYDDPEKGKQTTYGAKLTENVVQAVCRDLLAAVLVECEQQGLPVVLHVHDEIVVEVSSDKVADTLRQVAIIMSQAPPWADGFPIEVEGFASERYFKKAPPGTGTVRARNGRIVT